MMTNFSINNYKHYLDKICEKYNLSYQIEDDKLFIGGYLIEYEKEFILSEYSWHDLKYHEFGKYVYLLDATQEIVNIKARHSIDEFFIGLKIELQKELDCECF